jgi:hypothetical protein
LRVALSLFAEDVCEFFNRDAGLAAGPPEMPLLQFVKCIVPLLTMQPLHEARERFGGWPACVAGIALSLGVAGALALRLKTAE